MSTLTLKAIRKEIDKALAERFGPLPSIDAPMAVKTPLAAATHPFGMIQTRLSQELLPGEWIVTNLQRVKGEPNLTLTRAARISLNVGCDKAGNLLPVFGAGFEQADTPEDQARLARFNSSSMVYDVVLVGRTYMLDRTTPLVQAAGLTPIKSHPIVHAVRAINRDALDEWVRWTAQGRQS